MTYDSWKTTDPAEEWFGSPPEQWFVCDACDGSGEEVFGYWGYEAGCGHGHTIEDGRPCGKCNGHGGWIEEVEADR